MKHAMRVLGAIALLCFSASSGATAERVQKFDFQPASGRVMSGYATVTPTDTYDATKGYGFTTAPAGAVNGARASWNFFGRIVSLENAIPASVLSDATRDCVTGTRPFTFRTDVPPGVYDATLWLGDVTTPRHQVRATVNGVDVDALRMDINHTRGSFDQAKIGNAVPRVVRAEAPEGFIIVTVGPGPNTEPISWNYRLDECPNYPRGIDASAVLVPRYSSAALQAITIHPAADPPLLGTGGTIRLGSAPQHPMLEHAISLFNAGDISAARQAFESLSDPALRTAKAAGLFWVAGHPATIEGERGLLAEARSLLESVLAENPDNWGAEDLLLQVRLADDAERYRQALGYGGTPAAENLGRSCSIVEQWLPDHPYYLKGQILWIRNRAGLDPRRCTVSFERAQDLARQLDPVWGKVNPYLHLYATDEWKNDGRPWTFIDWGKLAGEGPHWARTLVRALNTNLDLSEWWIVNRQNNVGEIGGGWSDDVELVGLFGLMGYLLEGASRISLEGAIKLVDGIWESGVIDQERGFEAAYADVEHSAEPTGDSLHLYPMIRYGDPEGIERIMKNAQTFADFFLTATPSGHRHFKANHMSATQIGIDPNHRSDIPLNGRAVAPLPWLIWYSSNPAAEAALKEWSEAWVEDAWRTDKGKPQGVFPNAVVLEPTPEEIGSPGGDWYSDAFGSYGVPAFPQYQYFLYNLAAFFHLRTGDNKFLQPFDALVDYGLQYDAAGRPQLGSAPTAGQEAIWCGGKLQSVATAALSSLAAAANITDPRWQAFLQAFASSYTRFRLNPTDAASLEDVLTPVADTLAASWPYRTTEGVMTDRIAVPGIADVVSYYLGADVYSVYFGLPVPAVTWSDTGRLFAAAVSEASRTSLRASLYLFEDQSRIVGMRLWGLEIGGEYVLEAGPAPGLGQDPDSIAQAVPFVFRQRGEKVRFELPGRTVYAVRIRQLAQGQTTTFALPDLAIAPRDISFDPARKAVTVKVHNIGAAEATGVTVALYEGGDSSGTLIGSTTLDRIEAPNDLVPRCVEAVFLYDAATTPKLTCLVDPENRIHEVAEINNRATWRGKIKRLFYFPPIPADASNFLGFAISNFSDTTASVEFTAYASDGTLPPLPQNPARFQLGPYSQLAKLSHEIFGIAGTASQPAWVQVTTDNIDTGAFFQFGANDLRQLDGAAALSEQYKHLYFTRIAEGPSAFRGRPSTTLITMVNPNDQPITLKLDLLGTQAIQLTPTQIRVIGPKGSLCETVSQLFAPDRQVSSAYVRAEVIEGEGAVGFASVEIDSGRSVIGLNASAGNSANHSFSAQLASGPDVFTELKLVNVADALRSVTLTLIADDGSQLAPPAYFTLAAGDCLERDVTDIFNFSGPARTVGSLHIEADGDGLIGDVILGEPQSINYVAALPLQTQQFKSAVFSHVANAVPYYTGLALFNPGEESAEILLRVFSETGSVTGEKSLRLEAGQRLSKTLEELVPSTASQMRGFIIIQSTQPLVGQGVFGDRNFRFLSAIPPTIAG